MMHRLRRHPFPVVAFFEDCLVLTYAFPESALKPLIPAGMTIDSIGGVGFIAAAFVRTSRLRPAFLPESFGQDFFLAGYRVFVKHRTPEGRTLRGLRILRSDADRRAMVCGGNLLTHYNYHLCRASVERSTNALTIRVQTPGAETDVDITAHIGGGDAALPPGSPFPDLHSARRFAGPLPYTFDYESQTRSIIRIKGVRTQWSPALVSVDVRKLNFIQSGPLSAHKAVLASAFHVSGVQYRWERGVVERLAGEAA